MKSFALVFQQMMLFDSLLFRLFFEELWLLSGYINILISTYFRWKVNLEWGLFSHLKVSPIRSEPLGENFHWLLKTCFSFCFSLFVTNKNIRAHMMFVQFLKVRRINSYWLFQFHFIVESIKSINTGGLLFVFYSKIYHGN